MSFRPTTNNTEPRATTTDAVNEGTQSVRFSYCYRDPRTMESESRGRVSLSRTEFVKTIEDLAIAADLNYDSESEGDDKTHNEEIHRSRREIFVSRRGDQAVNVHGVHVSQYFRFDPVEQEWEPHPSMVQVDEMSPARYRAISYAVNSVLRGLPEMQHIDMDDALRAHLVSRLEEAFDSSRNSLIDLSNEELSTIKTRVKSQKSKAKQKAERQRRSHPTLNATTQGARGAGVKDDEGAALATE